MFLKYLSFLQKLNMKEKKVKYEGEEIFFLIFHNCN